MGPSSLWYLILDSWDPRGQITVPVTEGREGEPREDEMSFTALLLLPDCWNQDIDRYSG